MGGRGGPLEVSSMLYTTIGTYYLKDDTFDDCLTPLHPVFSNAYSNCLLDALQIGNDCICFFNLHYEFSNASSKRSDQSRRHGIVCIDLTF